MCFKVFSIQNLLCVLHHSEKIVIIVEPGESVQILRSALKKITILIF